MQANSQFIETDPMRQLSHAFWHLAYLGHSDNGTLAAMNILARLWFDAAQVQLREEAKDANK